MAATNMTWCSMSPATGRGAEVDTANTRGTADAAGLGHPCRTVERSDILGVINNWGGTFVLVWLRIGSSLSQQGRLKTSPVARF